MHIKELIKYILPYGIVIGRRNRNRDLSRRILINTSTYISDEEPNYKSIISVQGFGYSGSGAVLDILREYENTLVLGYMDSEVNKSGNSQGFSEIEIIRLPGGLYEIENNISSDNVFLNDALLNRTIKLFESSALYNYSSGIKDLFIAFLNNIISLKICDLSRSYYNAYLSNPDEKSIILFLKSMERSDYIKLCNSFLTNIFNMINNQSENIVADQLFSDTDLNLERNLSYIPNLKTLVVIRDPRDIYAWAVMRNIEWISHNTVEEFVAWYKIQYKNVWSIMNSDKCLVLRYENIVLTYDESLSQIESYLGYGSADHRLKKKFFNPEISKNFVGIYKHNVSKQDQIKIKDDLNYYCNSLID